MSRVCVLAHSYFPRDQRIRKEAAALRNAGHDVTVICLRAPEEPEQDAVDGVAVTRLGVSRDRSRGKLGYLLEYARFFMMSRSELARSEAREHFDVVQVHNVPEELVYAAGPARKNGAGVLLDIHDPMPELFADKYGLAPDSLMKRVLTRFEMSSCRYADHVLVAADPYIDRFVGLGLPSHRMTPILNAPEPALGPPSGRTFVVMYHGSVFDRYGLDIVLEGLALAAPSIPGLEMHLYGSDVDPACLEGLKRRASALGLSGVVAFNGYVAPLALRRIIQSADVGVCPLRRSGHIDLTYPTKLFEYLLHGLPVLAARTPAVESRFGTRAVTFYTPDDAASFAENLGRLAAGRRTQSDAAPRPSLLPDDISWSVMEDRLVRVVEQLAADPARVRERGVTVLPAGVSASGEVEIA
jgi:glycosyltransferase involved in cell wall biosynthesis